MSRESVQFVEMVGERYYDLLMTNLERTEILLNIDKAEQDGEISREQADELREQYRKMGEVGL